MHLHYQEVNAGRTIFDYNQLDDRKFYMIITGAVYLLIPSLDKKVSMQKVRERKKCKDYMMSAEDAQEYLELVCCPDIDVETFKNELLHLNMLKYSH